MTSVSRSFVLFSVILGLAACGGEVRSPDFTPQLDHIAVNPTPITIAEQTTRQLTATGFYTTPPSEGQTFTPIDVTTDVSWSSADSSFVSVSETGVISGENVTTSAIDITATMDGQSGVARVSVLAGVVNSLTVYFGSNCTGITGRADISQDSSARLSAEATFTDPTSGNVIPALTQCYQSEVDWVSAAPETVCVETADSPTLCPGLADTEREPIPGRIWGEEFNDQGVNVTATFTQSSGETATDSIPVFVSDATLTSIFLCPDVAGATECLPGVSTPRGTTVSYRVYGEFSDGECRDVTGLAGEPPSDLRNDPTVEVTPTSATTRLAVGGYKQTSGIPITVAPAVADETVEPGEPITFGSMDSVDPAFCQDPGPYTPDTGVEASITLAATVPEFEDVDAISTVAILPTDVTAIYVCPEDRMNENTCVPCPGTTSEDDQDACYIASGDTPVFVGNGLNRDFLAFAILSDDSRLNYTDNEQLTWVVEAEEADLIPNTADLATIENGDDLNEDGDTTEGRLSVSPEAKATCEAAGVSPCDVIVGAQYLIPGTSTTLVDALTATITGVQPTNIVVTSDPEDGCISSGLGAISIPLLLEVTTAQLTASVGITLLDDNDAPIPGENFVDTNFPGVLWEDPIEGTWDNSADMCVESAFGLFGSPVTVSGTGLVEPNLLVTGQACVAGSIRDDAGELIDPPGDDTDPLIDGGTITVDTLSLLAVTCALGDGFDSAEPGE